MQDSPFGNIDSVGILVRDSAKAIEFYHKLGVGPFEPVVHHTVTKKWLDGEEAEAVSEAVELKLHCAKMASADYMMIEPCGGDTLWQELLEERGEGIVYLGYNVDDVDAETAKLEAKGFTTCYASRWEGGGGTSHFLTDQVGGIPHFAIIEWQKS